MNRFSHRISTTFLLVLAGCSGREVTTNSLPLLEGVLTEQGTGHALPSVVVSLRVADVYTTTDEAGHFIFYSIPDGPDTLLVDQTPWQRLETPVQLADGRTLVQNLVLDRNLVLPWLNIEPDSLDFGWEGESANLSIQNLGGGLLNWNLQGIPAWLSASAVSGTGSATVRLTVLRDSLDGPLALSTVLRVASNGGTLDLPVRATVLEYPDLVLNNLLVEPVEFRVNDVSRATLGLGGTARVRLNTNVIRVDWTVTPPFWEGQTLGTAFTFFGQELVLSGDHEIFALNQISLSNGTGFQIFTPRIDNSSGSDLYLVVNYNTDREWLGFARIPDGQDFPAGYHDAGNAGDPVNVMLFPDTTNLDHYFFLGDIPAGRHITEPRSSVANLRNAFEVNSGLVIIGCCSGTAATPAGSLGLEEHLE